MKSKKAAVRGIYEHPAGSGVWWINYYVHGVRHREKVGRKGDAIKLYQTRKADALAGRKLPVLRNTKAVTIGDLIDLALQATKNHKDARNYMSKAEIVRAELGDRPASEMTPKEIATWLERFKTPATSNRYKAFISLCYREGMRNEKVSGNPARLFSKRPESAGRIRYLSREQYDLLCEVIQRKFPEHLAEFIVSVNTGMRLTEQYSSTWSQFDESRRAIDLTQTKNGTARTIHLNADALAAIKSVKRSGQKSTDKIFPREDHKEASQRKQKRFDTRSWFQPCLEEAKITLYRWHDNRHTFCSWLAMAGATMKEIQELAGHKTITMSARYAHLSPDHKLSVLDRIAGTATAKPNSHQNSHQRKTATRTKQAKAA